MRPYPPAKRPTPTTILIPAAGSAARSLRCRPMREGSSGPRTPRSRKPSPSRRIVWAIWSAPTIDSRRGLAYVATGDSYTDVPHEGSDAIIAINLKTGKIHWIKQLTQQDSYIIGCERPLEQRPANCPATVGADYDLGASPALTIRPDGKQMILASQKSSQVYALDPDDNGRVIWEKRLSPGGPLGGSEWGHAVDERSIYVGISDIYVHNGAKPQLTALNIEDGGLVWTKPLDQRPCRWS